MRSTMTGDKRRELQRKRRRLQESAGYRKVTVEGLGEHESPIRDFLALEASGWKGRDQVAMSCDERSRKYFWEIAEAGLQRGQFVLHGIYSKDRPMAMSCDLLAPPGCFGFKTGFDESFSSQAPGVCLVLDHIDFLYARPELEWMDACTSTGNGWVNRLWLDRKIVTSVLVPTGRTGGRLAVSLFPFFRWLRSSSRRVRTRRS